MWIILYEEKKIENWKDINTDIFIKLAHVDVSSQKGFQRGP